MGIVNKCASGPWFILVLALTILVSNLVVSCGGEPAEKILLSRPEQQPSSTAYHPDPNTIRLAVAPVLSPRTTVTAYQELVSYIGRALGKRVELVQGKTYGEINNMVRSGDVTAAIVCSGAYVAGQEDFGMEALVVPQVAGDTVYYSYLIVPIDSTATSLADLHTRKFAFTDPLSNSGRLVPLFELAQLDDSSAHAIAGSEPISIPTR